MKLMKHMTTAVVILSMTTAQLAAAAPPVTTIDQAVKNYRASVESGSSTDATASHILVKQLVDNDVKMSDISTWVQKNSSPEKFQKFEQALLYTDAQAKGHTLSNSEIQSLLSKAVVATDQQGVFWKGCGTKDAVESILFVAAGVLGIISLSYLHMELGQNGNMQSAASTTAQNKANGLNAAPNALAFAQTDQVNIAGDQAQITTIQAEINATPSSATSNLASLESQLANAQSKLGNDNAAYTTDMSNYNQDLALYTASWFAQQDAQLAQQDAQYQQTQTREQKVAQITGIVAGVLAGAGTIGAFGHCND
jgi:hypothetical protein